MWTPSWRCGEQRRTKRRSSTNSKHAPSCNRNRSRQMWTWAPGWSGMVSGTHSRARLAAAQTACMQRPATGITAEQRERGPHTGGMRMWTPSWRCWYGTHFRTNCGQQSSTCDVLQQGIAAEPAGPGKTQQSSGRRHLAVGEHPPDNQPLAGVQTPLAMSGHSTTAPRGAFLPSFDKMSQAAPASNLSPCGRRLLHSVPSRAWLKLTSSNNHKCTLGHGTAA